MTLASIIAIEDDNKRACAYKLKALFENIVHDEGILWQVADLCADLDIPIHRPYVPARYQEKAIQNSADFQKFLGFLLMVENMLITECDVCTTCTFYYKLRMEIFRVLILFLRCKHREVGEIDYMQTITVSGKHAPIIKKALEDMLQANCYYEGDVATYSRLLVESLDFVSVGVSENSVIEYYKNYEEQTNAKDS